jgi:hypothetical protein
MKPAREPIVPLAQTASFWNTCHRRNSAYLVIRSSLLGTKQLGRELTMQFILTGFTHDLGFRVFAFEGVGEDRVRTQFHVRADLALIRRYGIRVQELPLLCRALLEHCEDVVETHNFTYSEDDMRLHEKDNVASRNAAAAKRKLPRRPPSENTGNAWRASSPQPVPESQIKG